MISNVAYTSRDLYISNQVKFKLMYSSCPRFISLYAKRFFYPSQYLNKKGQCLFIKKLLMVLNKAFIDNIVKKYLKVVYFIT